MKKHNFYFIGECAIILCLLLVIAILIRDDGRVVQGKESMSAVIEVEETQERKMEDTAEESSDEVFTVAENANPAADIVVTEDGKSNGETVVAESVSGNEIVLASENADDKVKIVVFGDSIWNAGRGKNGISEQIMEELNVEIYNCAIGGTTAAVVGESTQVDSWTSKSFNGMVYIAKDYIDAEQLIPEDAACEVIQDVNFEEIDYVIVSYGLNDYFCDVPVYPKEYYDLNSFVGALRHGARKLQKEYPNLEVILTSPTYCEWFKGERQYELGTYTECARSVAQELELHFLDMYHALGKNPDEKTQYLSDGVHLNDEGMTLYANWVVEYLKELGVE